MRFKLIEVGRHKFSGEVGANTESGLLRHIRQHLASRDISIIWDGNKGCIYAGIRFVGEIEVIE